MIAIYMMLAFGGGILFSAHVAPEFPYGMTAVGVAISALWWRGSSHGRTTLIYAALFMLGGLRLGEAQPEQSPNHIVHLNNRGWAQIEGIIVAEPDERDTVTHLRVEVERVYWQGQYHEAQGIVLVSTSAEDNFAYGDKIVALGRLRPPPELDGFSYRDYLARQNILSQMSPSQIQIVSRHHGSEFTRILLEIKHAAHQTIHEQLPEPQAGLLVGILLGDEQGLSPEVKDTFNATGTAHVIAISGFNMALIASILSAILGSFTRHAWINVTIGGTVILGYTIFVGASPSVVRAAMMSLVLISGRMFKRPTYAPASLSFTAVVMMGLDPWVLWDIGFQLSFAAVLGMALLTPRFDRGFRAWLQNLLGEKHGKGLAKVLSEPIVVTFIAQISTLPIILYYFGRLSIVAPLTNFLVIPVQPLLLMFGGAATLMSFVFAPLGALLYDGTWLFLTWTLGTVRTFGTLPIADAEFQLSQPFLMSFAVVALAFTLVNGPRPPWYEKLYQNWLQTLKRPFSLALRYAPIIAALVLLGGMAQALTHPADGELHVVFLNMGQSNSTLIRTPNGAVFLLDGGRFPSRLETALDDRLPPDRREIDVLFISSDETDDIGALFELMEQYEIHAVVTGVTKSTRGSYYQLIEAFKTDGVPVIEATAGWRVQTDDGVVVEVLAPIIDPEDPEAYLVNDLVLRVVYKDAVFLLTSSLSTSEEQILLGNPHLVQATAYLAAEHGMAGSNSAGWVGTIHPQVVVIQNDPSRSDGIANEVLERFSTLDLYRTDVRGLINIRTDGQTLWIQTE